MLFNDFIKNEAKNLYKTILLGLFTKENLEEINEIDYINTPEKEFLSYLTEDVDKEIVEGHFKQYLMHYEVSDITDHFNEYYGKDIKYEEEWEFIDGLYRKIRSRMFKKIKKDFK